MKMSVSNINTKLREAEKLAQGGNPNEGMKIILQILENDNKNKEALESAKLIVGIEHDKIYNSILSDPLLDPIFAQCAKCGRTWSINPLFAQMNKSRLFVTNAIGGICPKCKNVYCRECAEKKGGHLACPNHRFGKPNLDILTIPNGRLNRYRAQRSRPKRLAHVVIFCYSPGPPRLPGYVQIILENMCSEAFTDRSRISAEIYDEIDITTVMAFLSVRGQINGWPDYLNQEKFEIYTNDFEDPDGGKGLLVTVYEK